MLTLVIDPEYPQAALEDCSILVEMLSDYLTTDRPMETGDFARAGAGLVFRAVIQAQDTILTLINDLQRGEHGEVRPMKRAPAPIPAGTVRVKPVPEEAIELIAGMVKEARAPRLTEARQAGAKRRRAA